jgi:hypothetical protein
MSPAPHEEDLAVSLQWRIDQVCLRFENAWKAGQRPPLEAYLVFAGKYETACCQLLYGRNQPRRFSQSS